MGLSAFIRNNKGAIIQDWEYFARENIPPARNLDARAIRDHIEGILDFIADDLSSFQTMGEQSDKSQGLGPKSGGVRDSMAETHAELRFLEGFDILEMMSEFRALRASVIRLWDESRSQTGSDYREIVRFSEAIDQILSEGLTRYASKVDQARELFLGTLIHDLRNPLGAVVQSSQLLNLVGPLNEKQSLLAAQIMRSSNRIDKLVKELIDVVRARLGGGIPVSMHEMDLKDVIVAAASEMKAQHNQVDIRVDVTGDLHGCWDFSRLGQVLSNLIGNAVQHGAKGSPIIVGAKGRDADIMLSVHNRGAPIPPAMLDTLFDPLSRGKEAAQMTSATSSLGLGLFIVKEIVEAHGGEVRVFSTQEEGTTFFIRLPRRPGKEAVMPSPSSVVQRPPHLTSVQPRPDAAPEDRGARTNDG